VTDRSEPSSSESDVGDIGLLPLEEMIMREAISGIPVSVGTCAELFTEFTDDEIQAAIRRLSEDLGYLKPAEDREPDEYMCYVYDRRGPRRLLREFRVDPK